MRAKHSTPVAGGDGFEYQAQFSGSHSLHTTAAVPAISEEEGVETNGNSSDPAESVRPSSALEVVPQHLPDSAISATSSKHLSRLWIMDCFPSGFWPRLLCRVVKGSLSTDILSYHLPLCDLSQFNLEALVDERGNAVGVHHGPLHWYCWSDRLELKWQDSILMQLTLNGARSASCPAEMPYKVYSECEVDGQHVEDLGTSKSSVQLDIDTSIWAAFAAAYSSEGAGWQVAFSRPMWWGNEFTGLAGRIAATWMSRITQTISILISDWFHGVVRSTELQCVMPCPMCLSEDMPDPERLVSFQAAESTHRRAGNARPRDSGESPLVSFARRNHEPIAANGSTDQQPAGNGVPNYLQADSVICFRLSSLVFCLQQKDMFASASTAEAEPDSESPSRQGLVQCPKHGFFLAAQQAPDLVRRFVSYLSRLSSVSSCNMLLEYSQSPLEYVCLSVAAIECTILSLI